MQLQVAPAQEAQFEKMRNTYSELLCQALLIIYKRVLEKMQLRAYRKAAYWF